MCGYRVLCLAVDRSRILICAEPIHYSATNIFFFKLTSATHNASQTLTQCLRVLSPFGCTLPLCSSESMRCTDRRKLLQNNCSARDKDSGCWSDLLNSTAVCQCRALASRFIRTRVDKIQMRLSPNDTISFSALTETKSVSAGIVISTCWENMGGIPNDRTPTD